jgi:hypothetical protein
MELETNADHVEAELERLAIESRPPGEVCPPPPPPASIDAVN